METVSSKTISETGVLNSNECQLNLELSDEQKNRSGKKKRKSRRKKNEVKSNDSHIINQNGKADEAASFEEIKEGKANKTTSQDQAEEPRVTLLSIDPISSTKEDSLPDANRNGSNRKRSRRKKKKKDALDEEKMLDDAEKTAKEDQVHPPKNPLSNTTIQEDFCQQAQYSCEKPEAAQLHTDPISSTRDEIQSDAMTCSERKRQRKKRKKDKDQNALRETVVDTKSEATTKCDASHDSEAEGPKLMSVEETNVASAVRNCCLKSKDDTTEPQNGAEVKADDTVSQTQNLKAKKKKRSKTKTMEVCDPLENTLATSVKGRSVERIEPACVSDVTTRKRKAKKKKTSSTDQKIADMEVEVCDPSCHSNAGQEFMGEDRTSKTENSAAGEIQAEGINDVGHKRKKRKRDKIEKCESVATMDSDTEQCLLSHSKRGVENCDGISDGKIALKDLASKIEDSATEGTSFQSVENIKKRKKDEGGEVDQDASGAEGVDMVEVKTKKKKRKSKKKKDSCEDQETDKMDEEKDETSLSSSVLIQNNVVQGVASLETEDLIRCSCEGRSTRKLVVFDLNGILADIVQGYTGQFVPDGRISSRSIFRRPFVASFLDFSFERFDVGIWSSRRIGLDYMNHIVLGNHARNLLFCYDQSICITTNFKTLENSTKPLFLKDLRRVWNSFGTCLTCGKQKYDEKNTILVDDSPHKALCNPPHTGIFPFPYQYTNRNDSALGPDGELRKYLERLADAENVQKFVEENPIGQTAITERHESWTFYSRVIEAHK
uniref:FCP1 homology domain-containing protein n=1 Tax=Noccaea caerulescens TaxID=107243 RepID=A0A1J3EAY4_NOCCA